MATPGDDVDDLDLALHTTIDLKVYSYADPTKFINQVPRRRNLTYLSEIGDNGAGSFIVLSDDQVLKDTPNIFDYRNIVKVWRDTRYIGAFIILTKETTVVDTAEGAQEGIKISGEGLRSWFADAVVYPLKQYTGDGGGTAE